VAVSELTVNVGNGEETINVTGMLIGEAPPVVGVTVTAAVYVPTARLVGLVRTVRFAGILAPLSGVAVSQSALVPLIETVYGGVPELIRTASDCDAGNADPICQEKVKEAGVGVNVGTGCAESIAAARR
jgi:hypothetical protein